MFTRRGGVRFSLQRRCRISSSIPDDRLHPP